jgi:ribosomal protein S12 methylthiotransferase accessory factor
MIDHSSEGRLSITALLDGPIAAIAVSSASPVFVAAVRLRQMREGDQTLRFASGWGRTWQEAEQRCLMEAAERCSAQFFGDEPLRRARAAELGTEAVAPPALLLIHERQYGERAGWNRAHPGMNAIPAPWRPKRAIDWMAAHPGLSPDHAWLPAGLCLLGHERDRRAGLPPATSTGVAAGKTVEEAATRAFLELIERDAVAIWWYNRIPRPQISISSVGEVLVTAYAEFSQGRGRSLILQDLTHDLGVPVVAAVAHDQSGRRITLGFGAGTSLGQAACHAIGELAQCEGNLGLIEWRAAAVGLRGLSPEAKALLRWARSEDLREHPHLVGTAVNRAAKSVRRHRLDLANCQEICHARGLRFLSLDLTRQKIGVPVVRVVVPGLRPSWARFAPGRLYDVPMQLGWRRRRSSLRQLNPIPLMF